MGLRMELNSPERLEEPLFSLFSFGSNQMNTRFVEWPLMLIVAFDGLARPQATILPCLCLYHFDDTVVELSRHCSQSGIVI